MWIFLLFILRCDKNYEIHSIKQKKKNLLNSSYIFIAIIQGHVCPRFFFKEVELEWFSFFYVCLNHMSAKLRVNFFLLLLLYKNTTASWRVEDFAIQFEGATIKKRQGAKIPMHTAHNKSFLLIKINKCIYFF